MRGPPGGGVVRRWRKAPARGCHSSTLTRHRVWLGALVVLLVVFSAFRVLSFEGDVPKNAPVPVICRALQTHKLPLSNSSRRSKTVVVVVGLESSGSKLLAQLILRLAFPAPERGPEDPTRGWPGHGGFVRCGRNRSPTWCFGVMHLSLPHNDCFPDLAAELAALRAHGYRTRLVLALRDQSISLRSKLVTHQRDRTTARIEQEIGTQLLAALATQDEGEDAPPPVLFSYESLMVLRGTYITRLAHGLNLTMTPEDDHHHHTFLHLQDGNPKWMTVGLLLKSWSFRGVRRFGFLARAPAFTT